MLFEADAKLPADGIFQWSFLVAAANDDDDDVCHLVKREIRHFNAAILNWYPWIRTSSERNSK